MLLLKRVYEGKCTVLPYDFGYFTGFAIFNEREEHVAFSYDECQRCCENFEVEWTGVDGIDQLYGMTLNSPQIEITQEEEDDSKTSVTCKITSKSKEIICYVSNEHNGYYAHEVFIAENDDLVHDLVI